MAKSAPRTGTNFSVGSAWSEHSCGSSDLSESLEETDLHLASVQSRDLQTATDRQLCENNLRAIAALPDWRMKTLACDVVLSCTEGSSAAERSVRSILNQRDFQIFLHLVDDGGAASFVDSFRRQPNVILHRNRRELGRWQTLHSLIPLLRTPYVAVQDPNCESCPERLRKAVGALEFHGGEIFASSIFTPTGLIEPVRPNAQYLRCLPSETLVFRRSSLVDMNGFSENPYEADIDLVYRASHDGRRIIAHRDPLVTRCVRDSTPFIGLQSLPPVAAQAPDTVGVGFAEHTVACDVVLPFHGQLDFVQQAIESILDQQGADVVLHLIDDASPVNTDDFLRRWKTHPQVRIYRNKFNLGQYTSFNNVIRFCETDFVAVQDGDDVSCRKRLFQSGNYLRLAGADILGGTLIEFDGAMPVSKMPAEVNELRDSSYLRSQYPVWEGAIEHFLFNGSVMMRIDAFKQLGGFSDYGTTARNRCNLDTEFYARAYYSGMSFAVMNEVVSWCRKHRASATRNHLTGWGTAIRTQNVDETRRRVENWRLTSCLAQEYGALGRYETETVPWPETKKTYSQLPKGVSALQATKSSIEPLR